MIGALIRMFGRFEKDLSVQKLSILRTLNRIEEFLESEFHRDDISIKVV